MSKNISADYLIIGGGIAGASAGYALAGKGKVILLEKESQTAYHSTGRSAAIYTTTYNEGDPILRALVLASADHLKNPPDGFTDHDLLRPRQMLHIAPKENHEKLAALYKSLMDIKADVSLINKDQLQQILPLLSPDYAHEAILENGIADMDVHALQEGYMRAMRQNGAKILTSKTVKNIRRDKGLWRVQAGNDTYEAPVVINAAGAWVDDIAAMAGVRKIGIQPLRRTAILVSPPENTDVKDWPFVMEAVDGFYFKPDAGKILISPADANPSEPCDAQPEEMDVAYAAHYLENALNFKVEKIDHRWAGLRNHVKDGHPVVGFAPDADGFFWLAAQGGFGVKTSPALGRITAALVQGQPLPQDIQDLGLTESHIGVSRLF